MSELSNKKSKKEYLNVLEILLKSFPQNILPEICLLGSVNLYLQGVPVKPKKDLDLGTNYKNVVLLSKSFKKFTTKSCINKEGDDYLPFAHLFINIRGFEVEFFDTKDYGNSYYLGAIEEENLQKLKIGNFEIPSLILEKELEIYKKTDKLEKIKILEEYLKNSSGMC